MAEPGPRPLRVRVRSIHSGLAGELSDDRRLRIHSVFPHAVNLEGADGLLTVASCDVPNAPRTMILDRQDLDGCGIRAGEAATLEGRRIALGQLSLRIDGAQAWTPALPPTPPARDPRPAIAAALCAHGRRGGALPARGAVRPGSALSARDADPADGAFRPGSAPPTRDADPAGDAVRPGSALPKGGADPADDPDRSDSARLANSAHLANSARPPGGALSDAVSEAVRARLGDVIRAASGGSGSGVRAAIVRLCGLGPGLTPSGDDALVGALVTAAWLRGRCGMLTDAAATVDFAGLTTAVSATALAAAQKGAGPEPLHALLKAAASDDHRRIDPAVAALAAIGHTSGTDLAVGVLAALTLHFRERQASSTRDRRGNR